ncbi:SycD/LcrH family type III secretion system chaperone [Salmonella enterica]|nr:SycD/LcrH family type III secretion system chaperone [Salmonella enterica]
MVHNAGKDKNSLADNLISAIQNGATLKDLNGISDADMQDIHLLAYDCYVKRKFNEALALFRFLYLYDFYNPEYALGIGAVLQSQKKYSKAIDFYALAYALSQNDYRSMFYSGECNLMLGKKIQAISCFEIVKENSTVPSLTEKAEIYLKTLNEIQS